MEAPVTRFSDAIISLGPGPQESYMKRPRLLSPSASEDTLVDFCQSLTQKIDFVSDETVFTPVLSATLD
jgi:hypothetical protein